MRIYVPLTMPLLRAALSAGEIGPAPVMGHAVTPTLREWYAEGDTEELEYIALMDAARGSLRLLARTDVAPLRRVVVAAEIADSSAQVVPDVERSAVLVPDPIAVREVVSAHVDVDDVEAVRSAVASILAADSGDEDARFAVDEADAHELQWYAAQELDTVVAGD